jgi:hypothetical protein
VKPPGRRRGVPHGAAAVVPPLTVRLRASDDVAAALFTVLGADQQQPCSVLTSFCRVRDEGKGDDKVGPRRHRRDADRGGAVQLRVPCRVARRRGGRVQELSRPPTRF